MKAKKKVLIVEDDNFTIKLYTRLLNDNDFEVISTPSASEAIELAVGQKPDLMIVDLMLLNGNGFEVLKKIRENTKTKKIPVITLSNLGQENDINEAIKRGSNKYFVKSNTRFEEVIEAVKKLIK